MQLSKLYTSTCTLVNSLKRDAISNNFFLQLNFYRVKVWKTEKSKLNLNNLIMQSIDDTSIWFKHNILEYIYLLFLRWRVSILISRAFLYFPSMWSSKGVNYVQMLASKVIINVRNNLLWKTNCFLTWKLSWLNIYIIKWFEHLSTEILFNTIYLQ